MHTDPVNQCLSSKRTLYQLVVNLLKRIPFPKNLVDDFFYVPSNHFCHHFVSSSHNTEFLKRRGHTMGQLLCCTQVDQSTVAIKERFGKFDDVLEPGCHCLPWVFGSQLAGHLSLRLQQLDVRCETKTKDNVFVNVVASVQYRALADKANDAFYKLSNTRSQIQAYVFDVIRATVPKLNLDDDFEQKNEIAKAVEDELEKAMSAYGFEIVQTLIVDIEPDEHVKRGDEYEINAAARLRVAATEKAEAEKILQIKRAEGEAESKYLSGLGIARQRQAIVDGLRDSVLGFSVNVPGTTAKDVMDMVLVTQYFDTMKEIGATSKSSAVFIPHGPGAVRDVASQIRDGLLQGSINTLNLSDSEPQLYISLYIVVHSTFLLLMFSLN
ncbi:hypothetical protein J5N97_013366 [Dioscorea zingiberensis]|uniref:Band 7 domain-containing protein n=1 Tax=Dioscorea zingiberensis TaxID=325984 RepID=A0A9D5CST8_9LILI|nr:hypothetical protein J5N97_013366 [Dioscorea zingiberensis]